MEDNISRNISKSVTDLANKSFASTGYFLVDKDNDSPSGLEFYGGYTLTSVTGLTLTSTLAHPDSADFPVNLAAGVKLPGGIKDISVTDGTLICFYG